MTEACYCCRVGTGDAYGACLGQHSLLSMLCPSASVCRMRCLRSLQPVPPAQTRKPQELGWGRRRAHISRYDAVFRSAYMLMRSTLYTSHGNCM